MHLNVGATHHKTKELVLIYKKSPFGHVTKPLWLVPNNKSLPRKDCGNFSQFENCS